MIKVLDTTCRRAGGHASLFRCLSSLLWALVLFGGCGPGAGDNGNGNGNGNSNDNGTGPSVEDLPDLSSDDALGTGEGQDLAVPGLILIGFDLSISEATLLQLAGSTATALTGQLVDVIPDIRLITVAVEPGTELAAMVLAQQLQSVEYTELDVSGRVAAIDDWIPSAASAQFSQYQLFATNAIAARAFAANGSGRISVAVLDTGCTVGHPEFANSQISAGANYVSGGNNIADDSFDSHGTGVVSLLASSVDTGEIAGLLPGFDVSVHKTCDSLGFCSLDAVVLGIVGALNGNADIDITTGEIAPADVINISLSFSGDYRSLARAVSLAEQRGVVIVAAAGNDGRSTSAATPRYPAGYSTVISVGATDVEGAAAPFSNRFAGLDLVAPGVDLLVANASGGYGFADGTSYAAAQVSAAAAWLLDLNGALSAGDVRSRLTLRGDAVDAGSGFAQTSARQLNFLAALQNSASPIEPYLIPDQDLTAAVGLTASTLVSNQGSTGAAGTIAEAFTDELIYFYGYFPAGELTFELRDGGQDLALAPESLVPSSFSLFLEFLRELELGQVRPVLGIVQQVVFAMPDLGGDRRAVDIVAIAGGIESTPRTMIYNPLRRGYNFISYKNFNTSVVHLRDEEGDAFDPALADIELLGFGARPELNWAGGFAVDRVQVGSSLDPTYLVLSKDGEDLISPPVRVGSCVGAEVPEQICSEEIGLLENQITRIVIQVNGGGGTQTATLDLIYVP